MKPIADPNKVSISTFQEFQEKFYPKWYESQQGGVADESFGRDLARYSVQRHFPSSTEVETTAAKKRR
jgi:hypothetical protein